jgi:hypothetical protein
METSNAQRRWNDLTTDVWSKALGFVSTEDLLEVRLVSRSSFNACESPAAWINHFNGSLPRREATREDYACFVGSLWAGRRSKGLLVSRAHAQTWNALLSILNHMDRLENIIVDRPAAYIWRYTWIYLLLFNPEACRRLKTLKVEGSVLAPSRTLDGEIVSTVFPLTLKMSSHGTRNQDDEEEEEDERPNKKLKVCPSRRSAFDTAEALFPNLHTLSLYASDDRGIRWLINNAPNVVDLSFPEISKTNVFDNVWPTVRKLTLAFTPIVSPRVLKSMLGLIPNVMTRLVNWTLLESLVLSDIAPREILHIANHAILPQIKELSVSSYLELSDSTINNSRFRGDDWPVSLFRAFPNVVRLRLTWKDFTQRKSGVQYDNFALDALATWIQQPGNDHAPLECVTVEYSDLTQEVDIDHLESLIRCSRIHHVSLVVSKETLETWETTSPDVQDYDSTCSVFRAWRDFIQKKLPGKLSTTF